MPLQTLQFGSLSLPLKPLLILGALYVTLWWSARRAQARGLDGDHLWNAGLLGVAAMLLVARAWYVVQFWSVYQRDLWQIFSPRPDALVWAPGFLAAIFVGAIYLLRQRVPLTQAADALAPAALLGLALLSVADFFAGDAFGAPTSVPWAISLWGALRHPVQLYQAASLLAASIVVARVQPANAGHAAWLALFLYALSRLIFDAFRGDSTVLAGGFRAEQLVALGVACFALWQLLAKTRAKIPLVNEHSTQS